MLGLLVEVLKMIELIELSLSFLLGVITGFGIALAIGYKKEQERNGKDG